MTIANSVRHCTEAWIVILAMLGLGFYFLEQPSPIFP
jgi:hypothetical protein